MENPISVNDETKPLATHHDENREDKNDHDDYNTPNTSRVDETTFTTPGSTNKQTTSTLRQRQKEKRDKLAALCRYLNVAGDLDLINLDRFNYTKNTKNRYHNF